MIRCVWLMILGSLCRRGRLTVEFIFAATEEAVFVHVIVSAKSVNTLVIYVRLVRLIVIVKLTLVLMCEGMSGHFQVAMLRGCQGVL